MNEGKKERPISPKCPECGFPLSYEVDQDRDTGEIIIEFWCDGHGNDEFDFVILTGLWDTDLEGLKQVGKIIRKEMAIKLLARKPDSTGWRWNI